MPHSLAALPLRAARWSATHPWHAILGWLAFVALAVGLAIAVPTHETDAADYRLGESGRADQLVHEAGLDEPATENVLITAPDGTRPDQAEAEATAAALVKRLGAVEGLAEVTAPLWSPDGSALLVSAQLARDQDDVGALQAATAAVGAEHPGLELRLSGAVSLDDAIGGQVADDLAAAEGISLPVTLALMLLAFGALIAAGIPVLLAATSVAATIGITAPLSHLVHAEPTVSSMIVLIGMAVGVDYSLFFLKRVREERDNGVGPLDAVEIAAATSGHSIVVSGLAVIASMTGLYVFGGATFNSLATGAILVVAIAVLGSITVLPAMVARLGHWVDRPRVPLLWRLNRRIGRGGLSNRILAPVLRHPVAALAVSTLALAAIALPAFGMRLHEGNLDTLPDAVPEVVTMRAIAERFPSEGTAVDVVVRADLDQRVEVRTALDGLVGRAAATGDFVATPDAVRVSRDGRTSVLRLGLPYDASDPRVEDAIDTLRADLVPSALDGLGADQAVGGEAAEAGDYVQRLRTWLPVVIGFVLVVTTLMMMITFRSVAIAVVSCVLNLASVGVAFGVLTLIFQRGFAAGILGFTSPGFVIDWVPLFVLVVLVGLSMDYHVFVLSRVREHVRRGLPTRLAVERGVADTAGVVTSAAAVMVSVFAIFATLSMLEMKMLGAGLAAAILVDATVIRLVVLPAVLVLLGDRAWWPTRVSPDRVETVSEPVAEVALAP